MEFFKISFALLAFIYSGVDSHSTGPPSSACDSMTPQHDMTPPQNNSDGSVPTTCGLSASKIIYDCFNFPIFKTIIKICGCTLCY